MSFDPTTLISVVQNCKALYDYLSDVRHASVECRRFLDEVHSLEPQLKALRKLADTPGVAGDAAAMERLAQLLDTSQPFAKVVDDTLVQIKNLLTFGTSNPDATRFKVFGKRMVAALSWTTNKAEVRSLLSDLERYKSRIGLALQHQMFQMITEHRHKVAKFISENDFTGHQRSLIEQRLPETGTWVLGHPTFVAWLDKSDSERTVWCHGLPGVGKSVIAALIVDHLRSKKGAIVLSVFCRYSLDSFTTPIPVLRGLLRQLLEKSSNVPPALDALYKDRTDPEPTALPGFINDLAASHARPIYIVIDALDECPIRIDLLLAVQDLAPSFRILVTSRPVFEEIREHSTIEIHASDKDILTAVDTTLNKMKHSWLDRELKDMVRAKVVGKANGMFLLASLQLRELERDVTSRCDVVDILDSLPETLYDAYKLTFLRILKQGGRMNQLACRTLAIMAARSSYLTTQNLQHLLAEGDTTKYTDVKTILQCCQGLVHEEFSGRLVFIHYSVHEYNTSHWVEHFQQHPNRFAVCLELGFFTLRSLADPLSFESWVALVANMGEAQELNQVIPFLSAAEVGAPFIELYADLNYARSNLREYQLSGTGTWVLHHPKFLAWRDDREQSRTLWCHGPQGVGKSVIAGLIVDHLQSEGNIVLSVFCTYYAPELQHIIKTPFPVLCGLLRQLIEMFPDTLPIISTLYNSQDSRNLNILPAFLAEIAASHARPIYVVIDALDEWHVGCDLMRAIQRLVPSFRLLVTSRPVFQEIHDYPSIQIRASDDDILIAVNATLEELRHGWLNETLKNTIRAKIVEKADGMFLLASLQLSKLKRNVTCKRDVLDILDSQSRTLADAYKLTFQRIRLQGQRTNELVCRTLALVTLPSKYLDTEDAQHLLAEGDKSQYTDIANILQCCLGLIRRKTGDSCFELTHDSVYKYVTARWQEEFPENPSRSGVCLNLGYHTLISPVDKSGRNVFCWDYIVCAMREPEDLEQVISLLCTPAARASLVEDDPELASLVHDPLLIACNRGYWNVVEYMISTAPPNVQRFNEALHACTDSVDKCIAWINVRPDMRVDSDGVVVAVDPDGGEGI